MLRERTHVSRTLVSEAPMVRIWRLVFRLGQGLGFSRHWAEEVRRGPETIDDFLVLPDVVTGQAGIGLSHIYSNIAWT